MRAMQKTPPQEKIVAAREAQGLPVPATVAGTASEYRAAIESAGINRLVAAGHPAGDD